MPHVPGRDPAAAPHVSGEFDVAVERIAFFVTRVC
jgi:hypothetical protein